MRLAWDEEKERREQLLLLRYRQRLLAQEVELNRLEIQRRRLELAILMFIAGALVVSALLGHLFAPEVTRGGIAGLDLGVHMQLFA
jgi:ParB-like chromosome segregation protein Spo0J